MYYKNATGGGAIFPKKLCSKSAANLITFDNISYCLTIVAINLHGIYFGWLQYKKKGNFSPTILGHVALIFYGALPVLFMFLAPNSSADLFGRYDLTNTNKILLTYVVASFGCYVASILFRPAYAKPSSFVTLSGKIYVLTAIGGILLLWIYDRTWAQAGGIYGFLFSGQSRMALNQEVFGKSIYAFFNYYILFKLFFSLACLAMFSELKDKKKFSLLGYFSLGLISLFPLMNAMGGTRLIALHAIILLFFSYAMYDRVQFKLRYIIIIVALFMLFNFIGQKRFAIRQCMADKKFNFHALFEDSLALSLIPSESFTGYIPAYIIFDSGEEKFMESQYKKLIPRTVARIFRIEKKEHLSKLLAVHGKFARNLTVFTVPLPIDAYFGLHKSYTLVAIYSFLIFSLFNWSANRLIIKRTFNGWFLYLMLIGLIWVYVRYDINRSFSRTWQSLIFLLPIIYLFYNQKAMRSPRCFRRKISSNV